MVDGLQIALGGAAVGLAVGMTGMGGGALMAPLLVLVFRVDPLVAVSSDVLSSLAMKPVGAWVHLRRGTVHGGIAKALCAGSVPAAFLGAWAVERLGHSAALERWLTRGIGCALLLACCAMVLRRLLERRSPKAGGRSAQAVRLAPTVAIGAVGGLMVGATSVGAGSLMMVMLIALYPSLEGASLVGTDLVQAIPLVASAALGHLLFGEVHLGLTGWLVVGAVPATWFGAQLSARAPAGLIRVALFGVLLASGLKLLGLGTGWLWAALLVAGLGTMAGVARAAGGRRRDVAGLDTRT